MKIILLPGQSIDNRGWIENVRLKFLEKYDDVEIMYYSHWDRGENVANVELETENFLKLVDSYGQDYIVFAKSIGTVIFLNSLPKLKKHPQKVVMVGVPYIMAKEKGYNFDTLKDRVKCEVSIYQKENDPMASFEVLRVISGKKVEVSKYTSYIEKNDDHNYENFNYLLDLVSN